MQQWLSITSQTHQHTPKPAQRHPRTPKRLPQTTKAIQTALKRRQEPQRLINLLKSLIFDKSENICRMATYSGKPGGREESGERERLTLPSCWEPRVPFWLHLFCCFHFASIWYQFGSIWFHFGSIQFHCDSILVPFASIWGLCLFALRR